MKLNLKLIFSLCLGVLVFGPVWSQGNPAFEEQVIIKNTEFSKSITGYHLGKTHAPKHGDFTKTGNPGNYTLIYTPDSNFTGIDTLIVEYWEQWRRRGTHFYESYVFNVVNSVVIPTRDYFSMYKNDTNVVLQILENDSNNIGSIHIEHLPNINGGSASALGNGNIEFTPDTDFVGMAYVNYVACDNHGSCGNGLVLISVLDTLKGSTTDTIHLITNQNTATSYGLHLPNMTLLESPSNGDVQNLDLSIIEYNPDNNFVGKDTFLYESNDVSQMFCVEVLEKPQMNGVLVDDVVQCAMNHEISFDVLKNDVTDNYKVRITQYPAQGNLVHDTLGAYTYTPPTDYQGIQYFKYELKYSGIGEQAEVAIYINDGHPQNNRIYELVSPYVNVPYVLNYDIPIKDFDEFRLDSITAGSVGIYEGLDTLYIYCDTIIGKDLIVYYPPDNYADISKIFLSHCVTDDQHCETIEVHIDINPVFPPSCPCIGDCVWQGDINYDGKVNMKDLLSLGFLIGESGPSRNDNDITWEPQSATSWGRSVLGTKRDVKHADTDGDGLISSSDTTAISSFYYNEHSMEPELVGPERDFPFNLIPLFDSVQAGDLAVYEIALGDEIDPAFDLHGFAYTLNFGFDYDSSTLDVSPIASTWFTSNAGFLDLAAQPVYRQVDGGMTRTSGDMASGFGSVEILSFIVEEDVEGFKYGKDRLSLSINGLGVGANGEAFTLPGDVVYLPMIKHSKKIGLNPSDMLIYPNPSSDVINLHLNGGNIMKSAYIYDINGRYLYEIDIDSPNHTQVDLSQLNSGIYIVRINTPFGPISKKLEVVR